MSNWCGVPRSDGLPLRIAYFGLPLGALALAAHGFTPSVVCLGHTDALGARRVRHRLSARALLLGRPDLADPTIVRALASTRPDVILSWFWPRRIPGSVLALAPRGAFGAHPSLLPRWRGPDPYFWAIHAGDAQTGVSLHRLAPEYDTGAVIARTLVPIAANDDAWTLAKKLDRPGLALLLTCAERLAAGDALEGEPQDAAAATHAPAPEAQELAIDWHRPVAAILRLIRAAGPEPGATAELGGHEVEIVRARAFAGPLPRALAPADAVLGLDGVVVTAGDGGVVLDQVRTEQGETLGGRDVARLFARGLSTLPA